MQKILKHLSLFFILISLAACAPGEQTTEIPEGILPPDTMVQLLADLHLAESRLLLTGAGPDAVLPKKAYVQLVLETNGADTAVFSRSFDFYTEHPELFTGIYEHVITEISKRQAESKQK